MLERARGYWTGDACGEAPLEEPPAEYAGPVLVLRALRSREKVYRFHGSLAELAASLDDALLDIPRDETGSIGEIFIHRIKPGRDGIGYPVHEGYGENGIWVRGEHGYADPRVAGGIGTGRYPLLSAWIGEACWAERGIALADAASQVGAVCARRGRFFDKGHPGWRAIGDGARFRHVTRVGAHGFEGSWSAPPLRLRLRCWYEIPIRAGRKSVVLREEGLRGDEALAGAPPTRIAPLCRSRSGACRSPGNSPVPCRRRRRAEELDRAAPPRSGTSTFVRYGTGEAEAPEDGGPVFHSGSFAFIRLPGPPSSHPVSLSRP